MSNRSQKLTICFTAIALALGFNQFYIQPSFSQTTPTSINGAGSSFAEALYTGKTGTGVPAVLAPTGSWFNTYGKANPPAVNPPGPVNATVTFKYAAVGSSTGVTSFLTQIPPSGSPTVPAPIAFGATDDPITTNPTATSPNQGPTIQVPTAAGAIVFTYNKTGLTIPASGLKLSRRTYCGIVNGAITNWNDARIKQDNNNTTIAANLPIKFVRREDGSGTTFALSNHLNTVCKTTVATVPAVEATGVWTRGVGPASAPLPACPPTPANTVCWPSAFLKAKGGSAVADLVNSTTGGIGYVDSGTYLAKSNAPGSKLKGSCLQNQAKVYVCPPVLGSAASVTPITNAFIGATDVDANNRRIALNVTNPSNSSAYPIVSATYLLFYDRYVDVNVANGVKGFIAWVATNATADTIAKNRGYAPLPSTIKSSVNTLVNKCVDTVVDPATGCI